MWHIKSNKREAINETSKKDFWIKNCEVPIEGPEYIYRLNIKYCNPGIYVFRRFETMIKRKRRDNKAKKIVSIGDRITEINEVRTDNMTQEMFEAEMTKGPQIIYYT